MNPLKQLSLSLSKMPPILMLLIIIGLSLAMAIFVSGKISESENAYDAQHNFSRNSSLAKTRTINPNDARSAFYSRTYIPANTKIEEKQIEERKIDKLEIWDDATSTSSDVVGHNTKHAIPENAQIRQIDLE